MVLQKIVTLKMGRTITHQVLGLMSGTSLDGLDLALVQIQGIERDTAQLKPLDPKKDDAVFKWSYEVVKAETREYSDFWRAQLGSSHLLSKSKLSELDVQYGAWLANQCLDFIGSESVDLISSHGHTVHHVPNPSIHLSEQLKSFPPPSSGGYSIQIGNGLELAQRTGIKVIHDFRQPDIELGGQGAPLVPIGDLLLFNEYDACLNLGGFMNASWRHNGEQLACDIGPMNIVLNALARKMSMPFDESGNTARSGTLIQPLFDQWNNLPFYKKAPPKSLGREWIDVAYMPHFDDAPPPDLLHTMVHHSAYQWAQFSRPFKKVLATGGGVYNQYWRETAKKYGGPKLHIPDSITIDFKEAIIFALLGVLRNYGQINVLSSVTGASINHSAGTIRLP